jgi:hypothetical protein
MPPDARQTVLRKPPQDQIRNHTGRRPAIPEDMPKLRIRIYGNKSSNKVCLVSSKSDEKTQVEELTMAEAFDKFHYWKRAGTLLKLIISEKANGPEIFFVNVASIDEESQLVGFVDPETRSFLPPVNFSDAIFIVSEYGLEAVRPTGDLLICEEKAEGQNA